MMSPKLDSPCIYLLSLKLGDERKKGEMRAYGNGDFSKSLVDEDKNEGG